MHKTYQSQPVSHVMWVPIGNVVANNYNPNSVAPAELELLYISIREDGYTQPIVTYYDEERDHYVIVDGFHRYKVMCTYLDIWAATEGHLPIVVIKKTLEERKASTIRHNRARGRHAFSSMSALVLSLSEAGKTDEEICRDLGMESEELFRLKHTTGFAKLFADKEFSRSWETDKMLQARLNAEKAMNDAKMHESPLITKSFGKT